MKNSSIPLFALLLAACGSDNSASQALGVHDAETTSEKIARAESEAAKPFHEMTPQERADVLSKKDIFGNTQGSGGSGRPISPEERREILRKERDAGH